MIGRSVARRYLSAALGAADRVDLRDQLQGQLQKLSQLLGASPDLKRLLKHPSIPIDSKLDTLEGLLEEPLLRPLADLVAVVIDNARTEVLEIAGVVYQELIDEQEGVLRAFVATPMPLEQKQAERLRQALSSWLSADVVIDASIAPETIGGITVRVGDRVLDASLRGRLEGIRKSIFED
jgi:F-type H+-transporting ATPase subunit delta